MKTMKMLELLSLVLILCLVRSVACETPASCQNFTKCHCIMSSLEIELQCPKTEIHHQKPLSARLKPGKIMEYMCIPGASSIDYGLLSGFNAGELESVIFYFCPLPNMPLQQLFESMNITGIKLLVFQSHLNLTDTLLRSHLRGLTQLEKLTLSCNNITKVPEDLFGDLAELTDLDLRENNLQLSLNLFEPLTKLELLELGDNGLTHLEPGMFRNLSKLRLLNLWGNNLHNISRSIFTGLRNLESLDLHSNRLETLPSDAFVELTSLKELSLYSNRFTSLPAGLFSGNKELSILKLYDNRQDLKILPSGLLSNLTKLRHVYLSRCYLEEVPNDLFWGSTALTNVSFQGNALTTLPPDLFRHTRSLKDLDLSYNRLTSLPDEVFLSLKQLLVLRLNTNRLTEISQSLFGNLERLQNLDLEHNLLNYVHRQAFMGLFELQEVRMSHNNLTFLPRANETVTDLQSPFQACIELKSIYLSNNSISVLFQDWVVTLSKLERLNLSHNKIKTLDFSDMQFISTKLYIDLRYNAISVVDLEHAELIARATADQSQNEVDRLNQLHIELEGNPLRCDCSVYNFLRYLEGKMDPKVRRKVELAPGNLTCKTPPALSNVTVSSLMSSTLTCIVEGDLQCPEDCVCKRRPSNKAFIVDCSNKNLMKPPATLPLLMGANHTELNISYNQISFLPSRTVPGYSNVTHIDVSHNNISKIEELSISRELEVLDVSYNNLTALSSPVLELLGNASRLKYISLYSNPWRCNCEAHNLIGFIQNNYKKVLMLHNISCEDGQPLAKLTSADICYTTHSGIAFGIAIALLGVIAGLLAALYYRYQHEVKVWLYAHNLLLWWVTEEELDKDKLYDAFISYSHKDEDFVVNKLVPELEGGPKPFKLCLHYRDWIAGEWIPNQITRSVEDSRRTVVVLSPSFLESVWGRMEFRTAHSQALSEGRARVIVILYGDIGPLDDLDPELRAYLSMNTYVKWGDPWFWDKLRYALPHPTKSTSLPLGIKPCTDDKLELIDTAAAPPTVSTESGGHVNIGFVKAV